MLLPAPFSPRSATTSPARTLNSATSLASNAPNRLTMPRFEEGRSAIDGGHGRGGSALRCIRRTSRQSASLLVARPSPPADTITTATPVRPGAKRDDKALTVHMERVSAAWFASPAMARPIRKVGQVSCRAAAQQGGSGRGPPSGLRLGETQRGMPDFTIFPRTRTRAAAALPPAKRRLPAVRRSSI